MSQREFNTITKVLCSDCVAKKESGKLGMNCTKCEFIKYHGVTKLINLINYLDKNHPNWVWCKVYDKKTRTLLATYKNTYKIYSGVGSAKVCIGETRDLPNSQTI